MRKLHSTYLVCMCMRTDVWKKYIFWEMIHFISRVLFYSSQQMFSTEIFLCNIFLFLPTELSLSISLSLSLPQHIAMWEQRPRMFQHCVVLGISMFKDICQESVCIFTC